MKLIPVALLYILLLSKTHKIHVGTITDSRLINWMLAKWQIFLNKIALKFLNRFKDICDNFVYHLCWLAEKVSFMKFKKFNFVWIITYLWEFYVYLTSALIQIHNFLATISQYCIIQFCICAMGKYFLFFLDANFKESRDFLWISRCRPNTSELVSNFF